MKLFNTTVLAIVLITAISCKKYLDVVPDNTLKVEDIYDTKTQAWNALARAYNFIPRDDDTHLTTWLLGDEWLGRLDYNDNTGNLRGMRIMRGLQSQTSPQLGFWSGTQGGKPLYQGLRQADVFLANIDKVRDMQEGEIKEWKAQVKMLKAYYLFLLVKHYGPVVIPDKMAQPESQPEELFLPRRKVEDCFQYMLTLINEAIPDLTERTDANNAGQIDQIVAKAIKAKILFFRASPFFNGNREYFGDFLDHDGKPFLTWIISRKNGKKRSMPLMKPSLLQKPTGSVYINTPESLTPMTAMLLPATAII